MKSVPETKRAQRNTKLLTRTVPVALSPMEAETRLTENAAKFRSLLRPWYKKHARVLPWRGVHDPYATWLSEVMLQQTRVATVIDRYVEFMRRYPTIEALANASEASVLALWSGLGYYRRARTLHRGAQIVVHDLGGKIPHAAAELRKLPGIGAYTSAAIASIAFGESIAVVDGNVERVLLRVMGLAEEKSAAAQARVHRAAQTLVPKSAHDKTKSNPPGDHNQAMMELGATICLPRDPLCLHCPVFDLCLTRGEHAKPARSKQQTRSVAHLFALRSVGAATEVLLERRSSQASLMPGMLELPPLPLEATNQHEPVLRLRHAITNTNYDVRIFAEKTLPLPTSSGHTLTHLERKTAATGSLLRAIPVSAESLFWTPAERLLELPLTGLARKVLHRLGVMTIPESRAANFHDRILPSGE
jgi:A/G-specific adenine glycosylase